MVPGVGDENLAALPADGDADGFGELARPRAETAIGVERIAVRIKLDDALVARVYDPHVALCVNCDGARAVEQRWPIAACLPAEIAELSPLRHELARCVKFL